MSSITVQETVLCSVGDTAPFEGHTNHPGWCCDYLRTPSTSNSDTDKLENHSKAISDSLELQKLKMAQPQLQPQKETRQ